MATSTEILYVRYELADTDPALPLMSDDEIDYFLTKHSGSIPRASIDVARAALFKLSMNSNDEQVDIFSIKGSKSSNAYKEALMLYIKNNALNPINQTLSGYVGGVYKDDMLANDLDTNNNLVPNPSSDTLVIKVSSPLSESDYFSA